ncbi:MBL fold metallo-hydrolase [Paludibacterium purpuratum]|uniref:L-ascorbate metabolism protein UlaG (Beta-lactamase superfamily) n=1 Tax=Paludibacterium purpuratum TaxID=1144873 RepID=A0A4R7B0P3_9NEIS|nr:MBL fold metallo-hydrolase [Paludibacterium purpuratum]TDR76496.1 L-ascorbate metabolism protein UlaG (beta-lactamase superfamily) [Paludibacterium purpuratum]
MLGLMWQFLFNKPVDTVPGGAIPLVSLTRAQLDAAADGSLWRLGHSTVLLKLHGVFWLTDPVFAKRASPVQWAGPRRFHPAPIGIDELPPIQAVILSHDHYDHLDRAAIMQLAGKTAWFLTPLGVGERLIGWGIDPAKVRQLDWWQETAVAGVRFVATPAQHFSGRGLFDGNRTLWASWVMLAGDLRVFFSGDSGYFDGFKTIGDRYGPFDLTLMETGAYDVNWPAVHMQPEQTLQAHFDLKGRVLLPIHNGTFDLALHAWDAPFEHIVALAEAHGVPLATPRMGETVVIRRADNNRRWWRAVARREARCGHQRRTFSFSNSRG